MKIIFMGTPEFAKPVLKALIEHHEVLGVVTQTDKKAHRGKMIAPAIKLLALEEGIKVFQIEKIEDDYEELLNLEADLIVTCAYGQFLPKKLLDYPKYSSINVHASLLPKYRGGAPIQRAIMAGETETGISIIYMDEKMDSGDIISQKKIEITDLDTFETLHDKLSNLGAELLIETINKIKDNKITRTVQDESLVSYAKIITREDELINFHQSSKEVINQIRALNPYPGAYTLVDSKVLKLYDTKNSKIKSNHPGLVSKMTSDGMYISTLDYDIIVSNIKYEGYRKMSVCDFLNGNQSFQSKILGEENDKKIKLNKIK